MNLDFVSVTYLSEREALKEPTEFLSIDAHLGNAGLS
jgi:hypothetical protein